ncbi:MAG TPA: YlcI/YnfO family protein [Candidatus Deferrimicrobiaceae bacterium]|jgi:predicted transcriptional regulator
MSTVSLRIPDSLHRRVRELARKDKTSINQFIATALAEKISALMAAEYLEARAGRGSRRKFERALSKVRDVPPGDYDEM